MIIDGELEFSNAQAVTATAISTNVVDLGATNTLKDMGNGTPVYLVISTNTAATAAGAATVTFALESDSTANLATSPTIHFTTAALALAAYQTAGTTVVCVALPWEKTYERYLGVRFTVATGPLTAGAFDAFLTLDPQRFVAYANNYTP